MTACPEPAAASPAAAPALAPTTGRRLLFL